MPRRRQECTVMRAYQASTRSMHIRSEMLHMSSFVWGGLWEI
jgi:hypothetical protein